jgi:hypothetical protein
VLQEDIKNKGQSIKSFNIEIYQNGQWTQLSDGNTIGYKTIIELPNTISSVSQIRINILDSLREKPKISNIEVY